MKHLVSVEEKILTLLQTLFPESSNRTLRLWIETGRVSVNGNRIKRADTLLVPGQEVIVGPKSAVIQEGIKVLYRDEHLVVLDKPAGVLSVATDFDKEKSVHSYLKEQFHPKRVYPVHRLDRETSGVIVFAFTEEARDALKDQFEDRSIEKVYFALIEGCPDSAHGVWESFLREDERYFVHTTPNEKLGKIAITEYEVVKKGKSISLLRLKPKTGRKHQLRVHCREAGYPIAGDGRYGAKNTAFSRLCLHAETLSFSHPKSPHKRMTFSSPLPPFFAPFRDR